MGCGSSVPAKGPGPASRADQQPPPPVQGAAQGAAPTTGAAVTPQGAAQGAAHAEPPPPPPPPPPVARFEDVSKTASDSEKSGWYDLWKAKWDARLEDEYHFEWSEETADEARRLQDEEEKILGISSEGIGYMFRFFDNSGAHSLTREDWAALGTDVGPLWDADNESLLSLQDTSVDLPMEWFVFGLVKKISVKHRVKMLDLFFGLSRKGVPVVGPATDFHSYTWRERVGMTYQALEQHLTLLENAPATRYVWWDIFCRNQHDPGDDEKLFVGTINQVGSVCFSSPDFGRPQALTRVWCQYELASCVIAGKQLVVLPGSYGDAETWCTSGRDPLETWVPVDEAEATYPEDREFLLGLIERADIGGQEAVNTVVREQFTKKALGFRMWYLCQWERQSDGFHKRLRALLKAGADPNFTNGYNTVLDTLDNYGEEVAEEVRAAGGKTNDDLIAAL